MAIVNPPAPLPLRRVQWRLLSPSQVNRSQWTGRRQVVRVPGASRWQVSGEFPPMVRVNAGRIWRAFFIALDGQANIFPLRAVEAPQSATPAAVQVNGAGQTGNVLALKGVPGAVGVTFLRTGDLMTVALPNFEQQLLVLTANLAPGAGGLANATFDPPLRVAPADSAPVETQWPYALVALTTDGVGWDVERGQVYGFAFEAEEAF